MRTSDEVLREFSRPYQSHEDVGGPDADAMADEIVRLRRRAELAAVRENSVSGALFERARDVAHQMECERDQFASMLHDCENERDGWKHRAERMAIDHTDALDAYRQMYESELDRAERMAAVVEAAQAWFDAPEDDYAAARQLVAAVRAITAAEGTP